MLRILRRRYRLGAQARIDREEANRALAKAVELDPSFTPTYIHFIRSAFERGDSAGTARLLETYVRLAPEGALGEILAAKALQR